MSKYSKCLNNPSLIYLVCLFFCCKTCLNEPMQKILADVKVTWISSEEDKVKKVDGQLEVSWFISPERLKVSENILLCRSR